MAKIDLNSDLGESFGSYTIGMDEAVIPHITSANVGCGFHAGDPVVMEKTVALCREMGVAVGAHPGYPDLEGFGRREMNLSPAEVKASVKYQVGALMGFCMAQGVSLQHVKPHGALYNTAAKNYDIARAIAEAVFEISPAIILLGLSGSQSIKAARDTGLRCASEVFADRAYNADGSLVARSLPGSVIHDVDACVTRIIKIVKEHTVTAITGEEIPLSPESICVHGDTAEAVAFVQNIRAKLLENGVELTDLTGVMA